MKVKISTAGRNIRPENGHGLTLFVPNIRRVITLNRDRISFGRSKFRDLDLSSINGTWNVDGHPGDFVFQNGVWTLNCRLTSGSILLNDRPVTAEDGPAELKEHDRIELADGFQMIVRYCGAPGISAGPELDADFVLMFQSVSLNHGHIGIEICYDAARRMLVRKDWGIVGGKKLDKAPVERQVPASVTTREELYRFSNRCGWEYCEIPEKMYDRDVMLWLGPEAQVQYVAEKGEVRYQKWAPDSENPAPQEHWCRFTRTCSTEEAVRDHVRRTWPHLPHNRKAELDNDMILTMPADEHELTYLAEQRIVVWKPGRKKTEAKHIMIPDEISTRAELLWYLKMHVLDWLPRYERNDDMIRDRVLCSGVRWEGLKRIHWETRYRASDRTVVHIADLTRPEELSDPLKVPFNVFSMHFLPEFVKKHRPSWMK